MKKILYSISAVVLLALSGCTEKELTFDHERQAFATQPGKILIEAIMPVSTRLTDDLFIAGPFAGDSATVVSEPTGKWKLAHSDEVTEKWGIYLDPSSFNEGYSLADGFFFVNVQQGVERSVDNAPYYHTLDAKPGEWYNVYVDRWRSYFSGGGGGEDVGDDEPFPTIQGWCVFVVDGTSWDEIAMYAWISGSPEPFGAWPGMAPTGTWVYGKKKYVYFDTGVDNIGQSGLNFIFNNNNNGSQLEDFDVLKNKTLDRHYFFSLTDDSVTALDVPEVAVAPEGGGGGGGGDDPGPDDPPGPGPDDPPGPTEKSATVYVYAPSGWGTLNLYAWVGEGTVTGTPAWAGLASTESETFNSLSYAKFTLGEAYITDSAINVIINDGTNQTADYSVTFEDGQTYYYAIEGTTLKVVDPQTYTGGSVTPPDPPTPGTKYYVCILDETDWTSLSRGIWMWNDGGNLFSVAWPGLTTYTTEVKGSYTYLKFELPSTTQATTYSIIFNDGGAGLQQDLPAADFTSATTVYYRVGSSTSVKVTDPENPESLPAAAPVWALSGEFNGWSANSGTIALSVEGESYSVHSVSLSGAFKFVKDGAWTVNLGLSSGTSFALQTDLPLVQDGGDLSIPAGTYTIYLNGADGSSPYAWIKAE
ncbi:MAG: starch-binding protein [Bacteroidales bacterium]|nr:starch-binding protein [Bacteroidales bacterium]